MKPYINIAKKDKGVVYLGEDKSFDSFEDDYLKVRDKEGRLFSDELVKMLPYLPKSHPLYKEWLHRAASSNRFSRYFSTNKNELTVLDLGSGNGWFCRQLAKAQPKATIYGLEVNTAELQQAARLFGGKQLEFLRGDIFQDIFAPKIFDMIMLNASIQYFPDINKLLKRLLELLTDHGEIHILDSPFYSSKEQQAEARKRSLDYFTRIGTKKMARHYHHHTIDSLDGFSFKILYHPQDFKNRILKGFGSRISLFPWIRVSR